MNGSILLASVVIALGGIGTYLLLPHRLGTLKPRRTQGIGAILTILALILLSGFYSSPGALLQNAFFYTFATAAVAGAIATITSRNPVYSALWFASVVLSTSGLFLLAGAQFLAAGTIIVYAGAIIVTFLFVIMLAQSEGQAIYDRMARAPGAATLTAFLLLWAVFYALIVVRSPESNPGVASGPPVIPAARLLPTRDAQDRVVNGRVLPDSEAGLVIARALPPSTALYDETVARPLATPPPHVAGLGATLFTDHLVAVEVAGAVLFAALIGAIAIATPKAPIRPSRFSAVAAGDPAQAANLEKVSL